MTNKPDKYQEGKDKKELFESKESFLLDKVFIKDTEIQYIFKKTEKIVTALYLITNFMVTEEPLKWEIRKSASELLCATLSFSQSSLALKSASASNLNVNILRLSSLFDLAYHSGFISQMNYEILNYEISKLSATIINYESSHLNSAKSLFDSETFRVGKMSEMEDSIVKDIPKGQSVTDGKKTGGPAFRGTVSDFNKFIGIKKSESKNRATSKGQIDNTVKSSSKNSARREKIIAEVSKKGHVSIKDISKVIKDCSEKTLQRELLALVDEGVLKKEGERRWSRYSMI